MKQQVLDAQPNSELEVYVVWVPVLSRLSLEGLRGPAQAAGRKRLADTRVLNFLDPELRLGMPYGRVLGLAGDEPAWDVFLVFERGVRWGERPPAPTAWMHQLGELPWSKRLDARKLAEVIESLQRAPALEAK
ncbi:MAG: hypothetical protein ACRD35_07115 [Candidatus Acidiferrales bacterium]